MHPFQTDLLTCSVAFVYVCDCVGACVCMCLSVYLFMSVCDCMSGEYVRAYLCMSVMSYICLYVVIFVIVCIYVHMSIPNGILYFPILNY